MSDDHPYLYLTTTGWKTGKLHEIEIWFVEYEGRCYLCSENRAKSHWVQNIQHDSAVSFRIGENTYQGLGRMVAETENALLNAVRDLFAAKYHWNNGLVVELEKLNSE